MKVIFLTGIDGTNIEFEIKQARFFNALSANHNFRVNGLSKSKNVGTRKMVNYACVG